MGTGPKASRVSSEKGQPLSGWLSLKGCLGVVLLSTSCCRLLGVSVHRCIPVLPPDEVPQVTVQPLPLSRSLRNRDPGLGSRAPWMNTTWRLNGRELNGSDDTLGILITRGPRRHGPQQPHRGRYQCVARMPVWAAASVPAIATLAMSRVPPLHRLLFLFCSPSQSTLCYLYHKRGLTS